MDNQNQQEKRKKGVVDYINDSRQTLSSIKRASSSLRTINVALRTVGQIATKPFPWVWIVVIIILLIVVFQLFFGGGTGLSFDPDDSQDPNLPGAPGSGDTSLCQYTRAGEQHLIKSSILAGWINEAANSAGIPPSVLASVAMHENQNFLTTYDNTSSEILDDNFCGAEGVSCTSVDKSDSLGEGECTQEHIQRDINRGGTGRVETDRHRGLLQISSYFYPTVDACNIRESLTWAAIKLKDYILTSSPTEAQVKAAVAAYGGFTLGQPCTSHVGYPYDYCNEVWQDYDSCQAPIIADASSCPIPNGVITCGSRNRPIGSCGHCSDAYRSDNPGLVYLCDDSFSGLQYAMDIAGDNDESTFDPVYLPKINGSVIKWTFRDQISGSSPPQAIQRYRGVDELTSERYFISLHHTQSGTGNQGTNIMSGDVGARICANGCYENHVHVQLGRAIASGTEWLEGPDYMCKR